MLRKIFSDLHGELIQRLLRFFRAGDFYPLAGLKSGRWGFVSVRCPEIWILPSSDFYGKPCFFYAFWNGVL